MGSPTTAIYNWWGYNKAHTVFHSKRIVDKSNFNLIYWKEMYGIMRKRLSEMFRVFITKHVTGTCGINTRLLKVVSNKYKNVCLSCGGSPEATRHIAKCPDEGRTELFHAMVDKW